MAKKYGYPQRSKALVGNQRREHSVVKETFCLVITTNVLADENQEDVD